MPWDIDKINNLNNEKVVRRLLSELKKERKAPITGSVSYWDHLERNKKVNYRKHPELYRIGKGQQGVLSTEPYKSEILPHWKFKTAEEAIASADTIYRLFLNYLQASDFVGADIAKKFLHMGFTRARRYANHPDGKKYDSKGQIKPQSSDHNISEKADAARIFKEFYDQARQHRNYLKLKEHFINQSRQGKSLVG
jgi:hypothetical protein